MLENSFVHLPGIGPETEQRLWSMGLRTWKDLAADLGQHFGPRKAEKIARALEESESARESREFEYFQSLFKGSDLWRLYPTLMQERLGDQIAYIDIETTGLGFPPQSHSTTIAVVFDGKLHVEHESARKRELLRAVQESAKMLVTFNGGPFDLPFLRAEFGFELRHPHLDLRFWFHQLGRRGGLKAIQKSFPEVTQRASMDIDGFDAVRLWRMHEYGIPHALETLMTYNAEDTVVLEQLVYCGLNLEAERKHDLRLPSYRLPRALSIATQVCPDVYRLLRS